MIPIFRNARKKYSNENKLIKYLKYAFGEIVLVVVGILIALQINNWNQSRIQDQELNDMLQSIANGVESDLRELNLIAAARKNIGVEVNAIAKKYFESDPDTLNIEEASAVNLAFQHILGTVQFSPNLSAFESLKNSTYFGKLQSTDLSLLLSTYYTSSSELRRVEDRYNLSVKDLEIEWRSVYRNNGEDLFMNPWNAGDFAVVGPDFLKILRDPLTATILVNSMQEETSLQLYQEQILMGQKLVEMIRSSNRTFDKQTKLELSGVLFSFGDADLVSVLMNGQVPSGFDIRYAASGLFRNYFHKENDYMLISYPEYKYQWASAYFSVNALGGRVNEMDFLPYDKVLIEMRGESGGESVEIAMKDINDPPDGSESRIKLSLTNEWKTYEIRTDQFATADLKSIMVPLAFVFVGSEGIQIQVRTIQFVKD